MTYEEKSGTYMQNVSGDDAGSAAGSASNRPPDQRSNSEDGWSFAAGAETRVQVDRSAVGAAPAQAGSDTGEARAIPGGGPRVKLHEDLNIDTRVT